MPDLDAAQVVIGTAHGPGIWIAPVGTPLPATILDPFAAPWKSLGYLSDDGPTVSQSTTSEDIIPWQSRLPIRTVITERGLSLQFVMWELNEETLAIYFDMPPPVVDPVTGSIHFDVRSDAPTQMYAVAVDVLDGVNQFRIGFPKASLETAGDMQITKSAAIPLDVTLKALDLNGLMLSGDLFAPPTPTGPPAPPTVTLEPVDTTVAAGATATFSSAATGEPAPTAAWSSSADAGVTWTPIAGATGGSFQKTGTVAGDDGSMYRCTWTNSEGTVDSAPATLTVT